MLWPVRLIGDIVVGHHLIVFGEWYYPDGSRVPIVGERALFYRTRRDDGLVLLHRRNHNIITASSTGLFCCELPDATDVTRTLCIGLLPTGNIGGTSFTLMKLFHE